MGTSWEPQQDLEEETNTGEKVYLFRAGSSCGGSFTFTAVNQHQSTFRAVEHGERPTKSHRCGTYGTYLTISLTLYYLSVTINVYTKDNGAGNLRENNIYRMAIKGKRLGEAVE